MANDNNNEDYLGQLRDYMAENERKRKEESLALQDTPQMGMPLTRQIKQENPNIPNDDIQDYKKNVTNDLTDYVSGAGMSAASINNLGKTAMNAGGGIARGIAGKVENAIQKYVPENSRFREILDHPILDNVREIGKQERNVQLDKSTGKFRDILKKENEAIRPQEFEIPKVDESKSNDILDNWRKDNEIYKRDRKLIQSRKEIDELNNKKNSNYVEPSLDFDATKPGITQEELEEILNRTPHQD